MLRNLSKLPDYKHLEEGLAEERNTLISELESPEDARTVEEAHKLLKCLKSLQMFLHEFFCRYPSLISLFNEEFGDFDQFLRKENIIEMIFLGDSLFIGGKITYSDDKSLNAHDKIFQNWVGLKKNAHEKTQKILKEDFNSKLRMEHLECHCLNCDSEFKTKMSSLIVDENISIIDKTSKNIEASMETDISTATTLFNNLRKDINRNYLKVRTILKRSVINKIEKRIEKYIKTCFLYPSSLSLKREEQLQKFLTQILKIIEINEELFGEKEFKTFFRQLSLNIWKEKEFLVKDFKKQVRSIMVLKRKDISGKILQEYLGEFWTHSLARSIKRKIIYHMGPTNSGKTYYAIEKLSLAKTGCYLAPLRLLAGELADTLNAKGVKTTLLTGEEVIEVEGATHYSSTIEMAKLQDHFDCCVIDEIQMITDYQRGWAWTRAFVNIFSQEVHVCGDASVLKLIESIVELCGDELEIKTYERMTEFKIEDYPVKIVDLQKHDALVVFSRRNALRFKRELETLDFKISIVYGRLSPEVRREQARKFDQQETDIMVSTDAIAMGMNLPIRRIVFSTLTKFIDSQDHPITESEIKQIAGRAGRYKRFSTGYVTCLNKVHNGLKTISKALETELPQQTKCMVGPDLDIFNQVNKALSDHGLDQLQLSEFLRLFNTMSFKKPFYCVDLREMIELSETVEESDRNRALNPSEIFGFACAPVNMRLIDHVRYFNWILKKFINADIIVNEPIDYKRNDIDYLETNIKCVELYQWLSRHFKNKHFSFDETKLLENKSLAIEKLNTLLSEKIVITCTSCGCKLSEDSKFSICEDCFEQLRYNNRRRPRNNSYPKKFEKKRPIINKKFGQKKSFKR